MRVSLLSFATDAGLHVIACLKSAVVPWACCHHQLRPQDHHRGALQQAIITSIRARERGDEKRIKSPCLGVAWAKNRQSLLGYAFGNTRDFLQIYLAMPSLVPKVRPCDVSNVLSNAPRWIDVISVFDLVHVCRARVLPLLVDPVWLILCWSTWRALLVRGESDEIIVCRVVKMQLETLSMHLALQVKTMLGEGIHVDGYGQLGVSTSYESNVPFLLRFMVRRPVTIVASPKSRPGPCTIFLFLGDSM